MLEASDQIDFGQNNHGYRYLLNLSSPSELLDSSSGLIPTKDFLQEISEGYDIPYEGMLIVTEKHSELYAIIFLSPKDNFNSVLQEINPTLDSIRLTAYTKLENWIEVISILHRFWNEYTETVNRLLTLSFDQAQLSHHSNSIIEQVFFDNSFLLPTSDGAEIYLKFIVCSWYHYAIKPLHQTPVSSCKISNRTSPITLTE